MAVNGTGPPDGLSSLDCIHCNIRRLRCDRCLPSCGTCQASDHSMKCIYGWTLGKHIYDLFPLDMDLNDDIELDSQESVHSTRTARVYRGERVGRGLVAVKVLWESAAAGRLLQLTVRESWTWSRLQHDNIVPLWGIADLSRILGASTQLCMISPWMVNGNIMEYLESNPDANRLRLLWDIVKGVDYLHRLKPNQIIHGDLKGNNVLVDITVHGPRARLTDFGLSYAVQELSGQYGLDSTTTSHRGNPRWLAFERLDPHKFGAMNSQDAHSTQSDVFEMMRTFFQVLTGRPPFHELTNEVAVINAVHQGQNPARPSESITWLSDSMWALMMRSWNEDRKERPPVSVIWDLIESTVLEHAPWMCNTFKA
ncbi:kinase-like protein [Calocera viscosa TUFC12733]|uniref:Kinase-like protein n=1 Tax=Calocera viscosa (strain TUFC12733) TaxID=1330018 RepID=A0A167IAZ3_CALVF|nr:kinase-like protein [Calocera viscosa TUFC12733]